MRTRQGYEIVIEDHCDPAVSVATCWRWRFAGNENAIQFSFRILLGDAL